MASNWKLLNRVWHANLGMAAGISLGLIALSCPFIAHKWEAGKFLMQIHYGEFLPKETRWIWIDSQGFLLAFLIVSGWLMHRKTVKKAASVAADDPAVAGSSVTVLGLGDVSLAKALTTQAESRGLRAFGCDADRFTSLDLTLERWLVIVHEGEVDDAAFRKVLAHVSGAKPGSLKRLEFSIGPGLDAERVKSLEAALAAAGTKQIRLPATSGEWVTAITSHLCSQSVSLAGRRKAAPATAAKPAAAGAAKLTTKGFTLLEMMCVLAIAALLIGGVASAMNSLGRRDHVHAAVQEFASLVREARQTAKREGAMVRLAMLTPSVARAAGLPKIEHRHGWGLYVFRNPSARLLTSLTTLSPTTLEPESALTEAAPLARVPLIEELIGGWEAAPGRDLWRKWDDLSVGGELFETFRKGGFTSVREVYLWQPENHWVAKPLAADESSFSVYPADFARTPVPARRKTMTATLADAGTVRLEGVGEWNATDVWGTTPVVRWPKRDKKHPDLTYDVPALDFLPDGSLVCAATREKIEFKFSAPDGKPPVYHLTLNTREGSVWIR